MTSNKSNVSATLFKGKDAGTCLTGITLGP